jgi:hypothetical protein
MTLQTQARWFCIINKTNESLLGHMDLLTMCIKHVAQNVKSMELK